MLPWTNELVAVMARARFGREWSFQTEQVARSVSGALVLKCSHGNFLSLHGASNRLRDGWPAKMSMFAGYGEAHCSTWQECRENKQSQRRLRQIHVPQSNIDARIAMRGVERAKANEARTNGGPHSTTENKPPALAVALRSGGLLDQPELGQRGDAVVEADLLNDLAVDHFQYCRAGEAHLATRCRW
jgi:hypothetical protein